MTVWQLYLDDHWERKLVLRRSWEKQSQARKRNCEVKRPEGRVFLSGVFTCTTHLLFDKQCASDPTIRLGGPKTSSDEYTVQEFAKKKGSKFISRI